MTWNKGLTKKTHPSLAKLSRMYKGKKNPEHSERMKRIMNTEKRRKENSEAQKLVWADPAHRKKMSEAHKGQVAWNKGIRKLRKIPDDAIPCYECGEMFSCINWKHLKNIHGLSIADYKRKYPDAKMTADSIFYKFGNGVRGKKNPEHSKRMKKRMNDPVIKEQNRQAMLKRWESEEFREAVINGANNREVWNKGKQHSKKTIEKLSKKTAENWQDPKLRKRMLSNRGNNVTPTQPEKKIIRLKIANLDFVGRYDFWLRLPNGKNKNPDFKIRNKNKLIEVFGDYWHKDDDPQELISQYAQIGYDCLVLWESEINSMSKGELWVMVNDFVNGQSFEDDDCLWSENYLDGYEYI